MDRTRNRAQASDAHLASWIPKERANSAIFGLARSAFASNSWNIACMYRTRSIKNRMDDGFTLASAFLALGSLVTLVGMAHEFDVVMLRDGELYENMKLMPGTFERLLEVP